MTGLGSGSSCTLTIVSPAQPLAFVTVTPTIPEVLTLMVGEVLPSDHK